MIFTTKDFEKIDYPKILGEGAYSKVHKVKLLSNNQISAMKKIKLKKLSNLDYQNIQ